MIFLYRIITNLIYPFLFFILFIRIFLKKEDPKRYKEKILISRFNIKRNYERQLIWFHAASIGELKSVVPIIKKLNALDRKKEFLVTTTTLSSSKVAELEFKNITNCPVLVNTSFNVRGEPIVCSVEDAFNCFMGTNLDILIIEDFILYKEDQDKYLIKDYKNKFELD